MGVEWMQKAKLLIVLAVLLVVSGVGGFTAGQSAVPPQTITVTQTLTQTLTVTVTETVTTSATPRQEASFSCHVYFAPNPEIEGRLVELIGEAQNYVYAAFYDLDLTSVADALVAAKNRGVTVEVVVDSDENIIIIHSPEIAKLYMQEFGKLWAEWRDGRSATSTVNLPSWKHET